MIGELEKIADKVRLVIRSGEDGVFDLILILCDLRNDEGVRDDAAMDLGNYVFPQVVDVLSYVAINDQSSMVAESCAHSLGEIFSGSSDKFLVPYLPLIDKITGVAYDECIGILRFNDRIDIINLIEGSRAQTEPRTTVNVSLVFSGPDLDPDDVSKVLRLSPTKSHKRGFPKIRIHASGKKDLGDWSSGHWKLESKNFVQSNKLRVHLNWLLVLLSPNQLGIQKLTEKFEGLVLIEGPKTEALESVLEAVEELGLAISQ